MARLFQYLQICFYVLCVLISAGTARAFQSGCAYQIRPLSAVLSPQGSADPMYGMMLLEITTSTGCPWTATASAAWVRFGGASSGTGSGLVVYVVDANPGTTARTATIQVGGRTHTITQPGNVAGCTYSLSPAGSSVAAAGGNITVNVTATAGCFWGADPFPSWVTAADFPTGMGAGSLVLTVQANQSTESRTATVVIAGRSHTITQAGTGGTSCTYSIAPGSASIAAAGGSGMVTVTVGSGCQWTASSGAAWITISAGASGAGNGQVSYTVAANTATSSRTGTLTIAGQAHTVTQAGGTVSGSPVISGGGIVNSADFTPSFAPGIIIAIFGQNLAPKATVGGPPPQPKSLDGTSVEAVYGGKTVTLPLFFVSPGQVNAQLPFDLPLDEVGIRVRTAGGLSSEQVIQISEHAPRIFTNPAGGKGEAALLHANYDVVSAENPGLPGEWLVLYLTGLGPVTPTPQAGDPAGDGVAKAFSRADAKIAVYVNGNPAEVYYAGLAPKWAGLYQINFKVPENTVPGAVGVYVICDEFESQPSVTFRTTMKWSSAVTASVGSAGGTASDGRITLTIPAGALSSTQQIRISQAEGGTLAGTQRVGPAFGIEGLPAGIRSPIPVSIQVSNALPPNETCLIAEDASGNATFIKASVSGNRVTASIPQSVFFSSNVSPRGERAATAEPDPTRFLLLYVAALYEYRSPKGYFQVESISQLGPAEVRTAIDKLEGALEELMKMGMEARIRAALPIAVQLVPSSTPSAPNIVEWAEWNGQIRSRKSPDVRYIRLHTEGTTQYLPAGTYDRREIGLEKLLFPSATHLLFHFVQGLYGGPGSELPAWRSWNEAAAIWFEDAHHSGGRPSRSYMAGRHLTHGLDPLPSETDIGDLSVHGATYAGLLFEIASGRTSNDWVGAVYGDLANFAGKRSPARSLINALGSDAISEAWKSFASSVIPSTMSLEKLLWDKLVLEHREDWPIGTYPINTVNNPSTDFQVCLPDLSIARYPFYVDYGSAELAYRLGLGIKMQGGVGKLQSYNLDQLEFTSGWKDSIEYSPYKLTGYTETRQLHHLFVVNPHASIDQPHQDPITVQITLGQPPAAAQIDPYKLDFTLYANFICTKIYCPGTWGAHVERTQKNYSMSCSGLTCTGKSSYDQDGGALGTIRHDDTVTFTLLDGSMLKRAAVESILTWTQGSEKHVRKVSYSINNLPIKPRVDRGKYEIYETVMGNGISKYVADAKLEETINGTLANQLNTINFAPGTLRVIIEATKGPVPPK